MMKSGMAMLRILMWLNKIMPLNALLRTLLLRFQHGVWRDLSDLLFYIPYSRYFERMENNIPKYFVQSSHQQTICPPNAAHTIGLQVKYAQCER